MYDSVLAGFSAKLTRKQREEARAYQAVETVSQDQGAPTGTPADLVFTNGL